MNRATRIALVALAVLVVGFVATWLTIPDSSGGKVSPPASLFSHGLVRERCVSERRTNAGPNVILSECVRHEQTGDVRNVSALRQRIFVVYGGTAAVVVLLAIALGAGRRPQGKSRWSTPSRVMSPKVTQGLRGRSPSAPLSPRSSLASGLPARRACTRADPR